MELTEGWEVAGTCPGRVADIADLADLSWHAARVPGTAAAAVGADGRDFDAQDWWFRCRFGAPRELRDVPSVLEFDGIATVGEVHLNGARVLGFNSMWEPHRVDVPGRLRDENELVIGCRALTPLLARRRRPAARWRTRVVNAGNLRWYRTMVFGRSPGFAPGPAPVGPWRPVRVVAADVAWERSLRVRPRLEGSDGVLGVELDVGARKVHAVVSVAGERAELTPDDDGRLSAELTIPRVELWWPHTHGAPACHELTLEVDGSPVVRRRIGFRRLDFPVDILRDGLEVRVNGVPVFVRGAVWTPPDLIGMAPGEATLRSLLEQVRDAGMNMVRVVGTGAYEAPAFHDLCDELGIFVWQDLMFANLDYPGDDPEFRAVAVAEARTVLSGLAGRPSLAIVCGNSEVEQQPAMMGLDPELGRGELWDTVLAHEVAGSGADCAYVRSTPCGGTLPFHTDAGVTHYFGVSGYFRPVPDARRAEVRFASECLAFANVPDETEYPVHHPLAKAGVQRDAGTGWDLGAGWDFDDVRDHYLHELYGVDPVQLRRSDHARYLALSRAVSGEVMGELMGEWRRAGSPCRGALVLWLKDMLPGAGLGVIDHRGRPKVAYHHLRRALGPVAVWTTDEGVSGVAIHVANDYAEPLRARLRLALYRDFEARLDEVTRPVELEPHSGLELSVEELLGRFIDAAWAYRFGPPAQDVIAVSLESRDEPHRLLSQTFRFPAGPPIAPQAPEQLGIAATARAEPDDATVLDIESRRLAYGVRIHASGFAAEDDAFTVEPGGTRSVRLRPLPGAGRFAGASLTALNLAGEVRVGVAP
jgi:beta-mannosidase